MPNIVHVTHEAIQKIGGIGSVLEGLITAPSYTAAVERTLLLAPLFTREGDVDTRLGPDGAVEYSSLDGRTDHPLVSAFSRVQERYGIDLVYGRRLLRGPLGDHQQRLEVVLVDVCRALPGPLNAFKGRLHEAYGIESDRYQHCWEYEQYVRLAEPGLAAIRALGAAPAEVPWVVVAHEFMGIPTALAAQLHPQWGMKTVFYAHEVAPIRKIVEEHPGHDTMFYNVLEKSREQGLTIEDVFGGQHDYFKHALVEASRHLDVTLAVGDNVIRELQFLSAEMAGADIRLTYNGIPSQKITLPEALHSKRRLQDYIERLLGTRPDYIFTHVTRMAPSKGLWRDIAVMKYIEHEFRRRRRTAVLIVLSTEIGRPRRRRDILHMERWWDWPVAHREGLPDLSDGEALFYAGVQAFNARSSHCKILFINQFGFDRESCGNRMPEEMEFWDIRKGSDIEFGQSIYEPFGIAQLEALSFGSISVMSSVCGCAHFVSSVAGPAGTPNVIIADYTDLNLREETIDAYMNLDRKRRSHFGEQVARGVAREIIRRLPETSKQKTSFIHRGYELASKMDWDVVAREYFLPPIQELAVGTAPCPLA